MINENVKKVVTELKSENGLDGVPVHALTQSPALVEHIVDAVKDLGEHRPYVIKLILAVFASTFFSKETPIWLMLVGNPSSNKTTLVDLLKGHSDVFRLDTMTANPFSSGQKEKDKPQDLLPLLNDKCFVIKEYGTILGRSDEMVKQLLSDLVAIYDGEYSKHSPTRGTIRYEVSFSHIGCVTPMALEGRQRYMSMVGARFLFLRIPELSDAERGSRMHEMWSDVSRQSKLEVSNLVSAFCSQLKEKVVGGAEVLINEHARQYINDLALFIARARGIVMSEPRTFEAEDGEKRTHYEATGVQIEEPFRAGKQLRKLAESLVMVNGRKEVTVEELDLLFMIAISSMPVRRADILSVFKNKLSFTAKEAADLLDQNYRTVKRHLDELVALKILNGERSANEMAKKYSLKSDFHRLFNLAQPEALTLPV